MTIRLEPVEEDAGAGPPAPDLSAVRYIRAPWGETSADDAGARVEVPPGVVDPDASLVVFDGPVVDGPVGARQARRIARVPGPPRGEPLTWEVPAANDGPVRLYLAVLDQDGRLSDADPEAAGLQAEKIRSTEWIVGLGGKVPGSTFDNPHTVRVAPLDSPLPEPDIPAEELSREAYAALAAAEAQVRVEGARRWIRLRKTTGPRIRVEAASAYDRRRGALLIFGGSEPGLNSADDELWAFDEAGWRLVDAGSGPSPRALAAMTWVGSVEASVLFGGVGGDDMPVEPELWAWDGTEWSVLPGTGDRPEARFSHALGFDPARGRLVLFGGCTNECVRPRADTFEWGDGRWRRIEASGPGPRFLASFVFEPDLGAMLLVGGFDGSGQANAEVWAFDGAEWTLLNDGTGGPDSIDADVVRDPETGRLLALARGSDALELWGFDPNGSTGWQLLEVDGDVPPRRIRPVFAPHRRRGAVVLFGGTTAISDSGEEDGRTWAFTRGRWEVVHRSERQRSPPRVLAAASYDPRIEQMVVFGGTDASERSRAETFGFSESGFARFDPAQNPPARADAAMAYDPSTQEHILYGGFDSATGQVFGDTWAFSAQEGTWRQVATLDEGPGLRFGPRMVLDPRASPPEIVMFGGTSGPGARDTWVYREGAWIPRPTPAGAEAPPARSAHAMVYRAPCAGCDPGDRGPTLVGGNGSGGNLRDQWVWTQDRWNRVDTQSPDRADMVVVYDPVSDELRGYGGTSDPDLLASGAQLETFLWDGDGDWFTATIRSDSPPPRTGAFGAYFPPLRGTIVGGGQLREGDRIRLTVRNDTWVLSGRSWTEQTVGQRPICAQGASSDPRSGAALMYGGNRRSAITQGFQSTWRWDAAGWARVPTVGVAPAALGPVVVPVGAPGEFLMLGNAGLGSSLYANAFWTTRTKNFPFLRAAGAYDRSAGLAIVHGGLRIDDPNDRIEVSSRTFRFDDGSASSGPSGGPPRFFHAMTYDAARDATVLHGGFSTRRMSGDRGIFEDRSPETWILREGDWSLETSGGPGPLAQHEMAYDPDRERVVLMGGTTPQSTLSGEVWEYGPDGWRRLSVVGAGPGGRAEFAFFWDARRRGLILDGGVVSDLACLDETWLLPSDAERRPVLRFSVAFGASGLNPDDVRSLSIRASAGGSGAVAGEPNETRSSSGVAVDLWDAWRGAWLEVGNHSAEASAPERIEIEIDDPARLRRAISRGRLELRLRPRGRWANSDAAPELTVQDLRLRFRADVDGSLEARCGDGRRDLFLGEACDGTEGCTDQCRKRLGDP